MSDNLQINGLAWRGVSVEQLTKEQLVQAIYALASEMTALQVTVQKSAELIAELEALLRMIRQVLFDADNGRSHISDAIDKVLR